MADSPGKGSTKEPNLELPSLFGRRKKKRALQQEEAAAAGTGAETATEPDAEPTVETPAVEAATAPPAEPGSPPQPVDPVIPEPTPEPSPRPEPTPSPEPTPGPEPMPGPEPTPAPEPGPGPQPGPEPAPAPAGAAEPVAAREEAHEETSVLPGLRDEALAEEPERPAGATVTRRRERTREPLRVPGMPAKVAALVAGALTGLVWVALGYVSQQGCETVRGVGSCGGTVGLIALVAIFVMMVLLGGFLLRAFGLPDATSTSFLGVGLVAVLAMLFFLQSIDSVWMFLVVPVLTAATFLLSWWVTETFVEVGSSTDDLHR